MANADPCGMTNQRTGDGEDIGKRQISAVAKAKCSGSFDCAIHGETVNRFAQDDGGLGYRDGVGRVRETEWVG